MKVRLPYIFVTLALVLSPQASAQWMVLDAANLQQSIQQVTAWKKQYEQMQMQQRQLESQHAAMTGSRGLGMVANDPRLNSIVPVDTARIYGALQALGSTALTLQAHEIRQRTQVYDCAQRTGNDLALCQAMLSTNAQDQAYQMNAMTTLAQRTAQIQALQGRINATNDPKSIAELQARLQVESAQVSNDTNKLIVMNAIADTSHRMLRQSVKEKELKNLSLKSNGLNTLVLKRHSDK